MAKKAVNVNPDLMDVIKTLPGADEQGDLNPSEKSIKETADDTDVIDYGDETEPETDYSDETVSENKKSSDEELVDFYISSREVSEDVVTLSINLEEYTIPVDTDVKVPKFVKDYWQMLGKQKTAFEKKANSMVYDS